MITQTLDYSDGDTELEAYVAFEAADTQKPLVLIAHDWTGRREYATQAAERIALWAMWVLLWICTARGFSAQTGISTVMQR